MRIYGLDFTSAPSQRKPLTLAGCAFKNDTLHVETFETMPSFKEFEAFLKRDGPWVAGLDFAFGQPRKFINNMGYPQDWQTYVELIESMGKREWVAAVDRYVQSREKGDKLHFREVDRLANAQSPMKMYFIPVGRMFFEGARRLAATAVSIPPNRPTNDDRVALEVYPALIARRLVGRGSKYKSDDSAKQTDAAERKRDAILSELIANCEAMFGFSLDVPDKLAEVFRTDPTGDKLDALLAAVQAAWGYSQRDHNYGIPADIDPLEGWIIDPELLEKHHG